MPSTAAVGLRKPLLEERRQRVELAFAHVPIEIGEDVLDEDLAAELFAEEADVAADDRARDRAGPATRATSAR